MPVATFRESITIVPTSSAGNLIGDSVSPSLFLLPVTKEVNIISIRTDIIPIGAPADIENQTIIPEWYRTYKWINGSNLLGVGSGQGETKIPAGTVLNFDVTGPFNSAIAQDECNVTNTLFAPVTNYQCTGFRAKGVQVGNFWYRTISGGQQVDLLFYTTIQFEDER